MGVIKNFNKLAESDARRAALRILEAGYAAINTETAVRQAVRLQGDMLTVLGKTYDLSGIERLYVAGVGKCSTSAAAELERILGDRIADGIVIDVRCDKKLKRIKTCEGDHPLPSERNIAATAELVQLLKNAAERDLVLMIVSGGGSTLLCQPENKTCQEEAVIIQYLFDRGATIQEINTIRKHLSLARGGFLAAHAYPARVVSLIFSDVPGDDISFVASGPTVRDTSTAADAAAIADKYALAQKCDFLAENLIETPKEEKFFERVDNHIVVSNEIALAAMADAARGEGYKPVICSSCLTGEARVAGENIARDLQRAKQKSVLLYGGETTVTMMREGKPAGRKDSAVMGGRNHELALAALMRISDGDLVLAAASDGRDNSDHAGVIADACAKAHAAARHLNAHDFLEQHNSYAFFQKTKDAILTGHTGSNVSDLVIALKSDY